MKSYQMDSVQEHFKFRYKIVKIGKKSQQIPSLAVVNEKLCTTCTKDIYFFSLCAPLSDLIWWKLSERQQKEENKTRMNEDMAA